MATECYSQLGFGFQPKLVVDFAGGTLTTDAGLVLVREFDEQLRLSADVVSRVTDPRDPRYITHAIDALVRQRLYQIVAGYEDVNDADRLRHDATFQVVAADGRTTLGSQPTLSRLENALEWPAIQRLSRTGVEWFCAYAYGPDEHPADLVLDLDSTDDPTHGTQQLALFHGWYDQHMYHPLLWFEGRTGLLLRSRLRPGRDPSAACVVEELQQLLPPLRRRFPHTPILLRGDAGMATPRVEATLEAEGIRYVLGMGTNRVFKARVGPSTSARAFAIARNRGRTRDASSSRSMSPPRDSICASWSRTGAAAPPISSRGTTTAARPRIGSRSSNSTSTPIGSAVIASARMPFDCSCIASRCCCSPTSAARFLRERAWRRRRLARFVCICSKSRGASSAVSGASGFISRPTGLGMTSSPPVTGLWRARRRNDLEHANIPVSVAVVAGGLFARPLVDSRSATQPASSQPNHSTTNILLIERVVTAGDGAVTDSFVNNAG